MAKTKMPVALYAKSFPHEVRYNRRLRKELSEFPVLDEYLHSKISLMPYALGAYEKAREVRNLVDISTLDWDVLLWASFLCLVDDNPQVAAEKASPVLEHYALPFWLRVKFVISSLYVFDDIHALEGDELKKELDEVIEKNEKSNPYRHYYIDYIFVAFIREWLNELAVPDYENPKLSNIRELLGARHMKRLHVYDAVKPYLIRICEEEGVKYVIYPDGFYFDGVDHKVAYSLIRRASEQNKLENPEFRTDDLASDVIELDDDSLEIDEEDFVLDDLIID